MRIWASVWRFSRERQPAGERGVCYELAYEARFAADALRFAIKQLEREQSREDQQQTALVLLDAFDRLDRAERRFRSSGGAGKHPAEPCRALAVIEDQL